MATDPSALLIAPVIDWLKSCEVLGPPPDGDPVGGERYLARVPQTAVTVAYGVIEFEFLILVHDFR